MNHVRLTAAVILAVVGALGFRMAPALAQELDVDLRLVEPKPDPEAPATPSGEQPAVPSPTFRAVITARPGLVDKDFALKQVDVEPVVSVPSERSVTFKDSDEPMYLVVLIQGNFRWMGNESYVDASDPEAGSVYDGAYKGLGPAVDALARMGPAKSKAALLVYADGKAQVRQGIGDASALSGSSLGSQQDYAEFISKPFIVGLTEAWKLFTAPEAADARKILVVIGDGNDDNEDIAAPLRKVIDDLKKAEVEAYAIHYVAQIEDGPQGQQNMKKVGYERSYNATSRNEFQTYAGNIAQYVGGKYYVDFPSTGVVLDGQPHEFVVQVADDESEPFSIELPAPPTPPEESSLWWLWLLIILVVVLLLVIVIIVVRRRRRRRREPEPVVEEIDVPPPEPMSKKTVMLGIGGTEDSIPIVGWVVPLGGPNQYQTFKLLQGATKLGTGGVAHVVVTDEFMSTEHAEIVCSQSGFVLNDLGSTNGTYLNDRRITSHELVDNDMFRLGQTDFKFKSIN